MPKKPKKKPAKAPDYELRGGNGLLFNSTEPEVMLAGPSETGKTVAACLKAHTICASVPGAQGAIVRKAYNSLVGTVIKTFIRVVQPEKRGIEIFGGETPQRFIYPNGSTIWMGGMDNTSRVLSSERDFIYVNQAEELTLDDWETLTTRATGRGAVVEHAQLFGDCNPGGSRHWIRSRKSLRLLTASHTDNPSLYTKDGYLTKQGERSLKILGDLSGVRRKRLLEGIWATAEGAVFDMFDVEVHVLRRDAREFKRWYLCQDEGFTNPAAILLVGEDSDGRWHIFREWYHRGKLQAQAVETAREWFVNPRKTAGVIGWDLPGEYNPTCEFDAVDEAAAGLIAALKDAGVAARPGKGRILDGIGAMQNRLKVQPDITPQFPKGRPRLTIDPACVETINEFESHVWRPEKDTPVDADNHAIAAIRYLNDVLNEPTGAFTQKHAGKASTGTTGVAAAGPAPATGARFVPRAYTPTRR